GIAATMIEGYYRNSKKDQAKFFRYALSSAKETELWIYRAHERNLLNKPKYTELRDKLSNLVPQTVNYINKLKD
ncbi:four helix bundle protein, partial [bacterium]|nr:four helix bundle protein [bacterium]